jgi:type IX secretion system PorP/SprF family membrane protein
MKHKYIYILILSFITTWVSSQQLPNWSTFYEVGFVHNPALTAKWSRAETAVTYRMDYTGFDGAPQTATLSYQLPFISRFTKASFGAFLSYDNIGPAKTYTGNATYTYRINPQWHNRNDVFTMGLGVGLRNFQFDPSKLTAFDGIIGDPNLQAYQSTLNPDISVGLFYSTTSDMYEFENHFYAGFAAQRFIPLKENLGLIGQLNSGLQLMLHGGYRMTPFRKDYYIEPQLFLNYGLARAFNAMAACRIEWQNTLWLAGGLSTNTEFFGQFGFIFTDQSRLAPIVKSGTLRLGVKIDKQLYFLRRYNAIGAELFAAYTFDMDLYK